MRITISPYIYVYLSATAWLLGMLLLYVFYNPTETIEKHFAYTILTAGSLGILVCLQWYRQSSTADALATHRTANLAADIELFKELYNNSPVPYLRLDANGLIISSNTASWRLFSTTEGMLQGINIFTIIQALDETKAGLLPRQIKNRQFINDIEVTIILPTQTKTALLSSFPYGNQHESVMTLIDITQQKKVDTAKSEFVSLASHQLRTPISALQWNLELLGTDKVGPLNDAQRNYLHKLENNVTKMNRLIADFLEVSQLEMGTFATQITTVSLASFFENILDSFTERAAAKNITVSVQGITPTDSISTDERLLHNALSNLLSNAIKYTRSDGSVIMTYESTAEHHHFIITDTGMGIPIHEQTDLFSKFFRASNAKAQVSEGTGLGLYIVHQAVTQLGGSIDVRSTENVGTTFTVTLPR